MTTTLLPSSTRRLSTSSSLAISSKCKPVVGSSSRYRVRPVSGRDNSAASLTRWASPPESVGAAWPKRQIIESHVAQGLQYAADLGNVLEQLHRAAARHIEHVGDRLPVITHGQRLGIVAPPAARVALDPHVGQKVHLDPQLTVPLAGLAAPAGHVETEPPRRVTPQARLGQLRIQRTDQVEDARVRGRVRRRRRTQRLLIDADHLVDAARCRGSPRAPRAACWRDATCGPANCKARPRSASSCRCRSRR